MFRETTYDKGNISESIVLSAYLRAGFNVSVPFGTGAPYDLVVDNCGTFFRVQVKTAWYKNGCILYKGRRRVRDASHNAMRSYTREEVDYFAIYYPKNGQIYVVPLHNSDGCLRIEPTLNSQRKHIRWAIDFTWDKHVAELNENQSLKAKTMD